MFYQIRISKTNRFVVYMTESRKRKIDQPDLNPANKKKQIVSKRGHVFDKIYKGPSYNMSLFLRYKQKVMQIFFDNITYGNYASYKASELANMITKNILNKRAYGYTHRSKYTTALLKYFPSVCVPIMVDYITCRGCRYNSLYIKKSRFSTLCEHCYFYKKEVYVPF